MARFLFLSNNASLQERLAEYFKISMPDEELIGVANLPDAVARITGPNRPDGIIADYHHDFAVGFDLADVMKDLGIDIPFVFYGSVDPDLETVSALGMPPHPRTMVFVRGRDNPNKVIGALKDFAKASMTRAQLAEVRSRQCFYSVAAALLDKAATQLWIAEAELTASEAAAVEEVFPLTGDQLAHRIISRKAAFEEIFSLTGDQLAQRIISRRNLDAAQITRVLKTLEGRPARMAKLVSPSGFA